MEDKSNIADGESVALNTISHDVMSKLDYPKAKSN